MLFKYTPLKHVNLAMPCKTKGLHPTFHLNVVIFQGYRTWGADDTCRHEATVDHSGADTYFIKTAVEK